MKMLVPVHPGEILLEDFIKGFGITQHKLAVAIGVPPRRINEIVHGNRRITADTALRLGRYFGIEDQFWLNLQSHYDLEVERDALGDKLDSIRPIAARATGVPIGSRPRSKVEARPCSPSSTRRTR